MAVYYYTGDYNGSDGADTFRRGEGDDTVYGGKGNDRLYGGKGNDQLYGEEGKDRLYGEEGNDTLRGGKGNDRLYGDGLYSTRAGRGQDHEPSFIDRGEGDDRLYGDAGDDWLRGGKGDDQLHGGEGDDQLHGDAGDDQLHGDAGDDKLYGWTGDDKLYGGAGDDSLLDYTGDDKLYGGAGDDTLDGGPGEDHLVGGLGDDGLYGSWGDDHLYGGKGNDVLYGGFLYGPDRETEDDHLYGGEGSDILTGGPGADTLTGGSGTDLFRFAPGHSLGSGDVITDFSVAGANRDALDLGNFNIDFTRDLESQGLALSHLIDADYDGATDDRQLTLPDGGIVALLNLGSAALVIDDFAFAVWGRDFRVFTIVDPEGDDDAGDEEETQPETLLEQQLRLANLPVESGGTSDGGRARRQVELNEGELANVDAGELDGLTLPENAGGAYSGRYGLYWNPGDGGRFQLRFDDDATGALTPAATAAAIDAALEALNGITAAEVTGEPGDWTLTITADEGHLLQAVDVVEGVFFDGDLQLNYLGA